MCNEEISLLIDKEIVSSVEETEDKITQLRNELKQIYNEIEILNYNIKDANNDLKNIEKSFVLSDYMKTKNLIKDYISRAEEIKKEKEKKKKLLLVDIMFYINIVLDCEKLRSIHN